jgi:hypothetical protein
VSTLTRASRRQALAPAASLAPLALLGLVLMALVVAVLAATASPEAPGWEALVQGGPLGAAFAFFALVARYPCQATPLDRSTPLRIAATHASAGAVTAALWLGFGRLWAVGLDAANVTSRGADRIAERDALLFTLGLLGYLLAVSIHYLTQSTAAARRAEARALEARALAREAELAALRQQVSPHFLFNCLNTISALVGRDPDAARAACGELGDLLRRTLRSGQSELSTLAAELALVDAFLALEHRRFGDRLLVRREVDPSLVGELATIELPALTLLPLVENAVTHGIAQRLAGGEIRLAVRRLGAEVEIELVNSRDDDTPTRRGTGSGLDGVRRRLHARYGAAAHLDAVREPAQFRVCLRLPPTSLPSAAVA